MTLSDFLFCVKITRDQPVVSLCQVKELFLFCCFLRVLFKCHLPRFSTSSLVSRKPSIYSLPMCLMTYMSCFSTACVLKLPDFWPLTFTRIWKTILLFSNMRRLRWICFTWSFSDAVSNLEGYLFLRTKRGFQRVYSQLSKKLAIGNSLAVQWLELGALTARAQILSLIRVPRSHKPSSGKNKAKQTNQKPQTVKS